MVETQHDPSSREFVPNRRIRGVALGDLGAHLYCRLELHSRFTPTDAALPTNGGIYSTFVGVLPITGTSLIKGYRKKGSSGRHGIAVDWDWDPTRHTSKDYGVHTSRIYSCGSSLSACFAVRRSEEWSGSLFRYKREMTAFRKGVTWCCKADVGRIPQLG